MYEIRISQITSIISVIMLLRSLAGYYNPSFESLFKGAITPKGCDTRKKVRTVGRKFGNKCDPRFSCRLFAGEMWKRFLFDLKNGDNFHGWEFVLKCQRSDGFVYVLADKW